ncbi:MAG: hypothetical protein HOO67_02850 [Candidatus Peribacteraceae bacterium]|nr:hypothetical protein [Candidatus Peribacteraceae bacterium]
MSIELADLNQHLPFEVRYSYLLNFMRADQSRAVQFLLHTAKLGKVPRKIGTRPDGKGIFEGWNNVLKHQVAEALTMRKLCQALGKDDEEVERMETLSLVHNATMHVFKDLTTHFTGQERGKLRRKLEMIIDPLDPDKTLRIEKDPLSDASPFRPTGPDFLYSVFDKTKGATPQEQVAAVPLDDLLLYYIDALFIHGKLVLARKRIEATEENRQDLNDDNERTEKLGMKYWDAERVLADECESIICGLLRQRGIHIQNPQDLPRYLKALVEKDMIKYWKDAHPGKKLHL